ncbi:MAG TPA: hypothetical protein DCS12_03430 [Clostridiales bacterium]|nr:hypothetical protein [Clostridiales bacterium]
MGNDMIVALTAFLGTIIGSAGGVYTSAKLTNYRIEQLEKKVDKHNSVVERTCLLEEQMKVANHRIKDLEEKEI